jgi:hypothetical protein
MGHRTLCLQEEVMENFGAAKSIVELFALASSCPDLRPMVICALRKLTVDMKSVKEMNSLVPGIAQHTALRLWRIGFDPKSIADAFERPHLFGEEYVKILVASESVPPHGAQSTYIYALKVLRDELCAGKFHFSSLDTMVVCCKQKDMLLQHALLRLINYPVLQSVAYAMTQHYELMLRGLAPDLGNLFLNRVLEGDGTDLAQSIKNHKDFTREFVRFVIELVARELEHGKQSAN